jgi:3-deoxy-manno-octulosonate cytidylyltransferase (CMP-KDO synthetase)
MTAATHRSGTDRVAEANATLGAEIVVNVQGDEPLLDPDSIDASVAPLIADPSLVMSSLMCPCPRSELDNPATVKVVAALNGDALYFSRSRIPYERSPVEGATVMQHIGLYAYRREFLGVFPNLPPSPLEQCEGLEQLRALECGYRIRMIRVEAAPLSVDTPEDLSKVREVLSAR